MPAPRPGAVARAPVTVIAIGSYAIMAGYFTQSGVILAPAAVAFGRSITDTAPIFSDLLGGNLIGIVVSLAIFDFLSIKRTLTLAYGVMFVGIALLCATHGYALASAGIALVGFGGGLGLSSGAVILTKTYAANRRATAFLGTDCAFSVAGFIVPAVVGAALARGYPWTTGYAMVGALAALLLLGAGRVRFPATERAAPAAAADALGPGPDAVVRIALFGLSLSLYLAGQSVFLIWSPSYMQAAFGISAQAAGNVVASFWGPSIFGLITAAVVVTRVAPRIVLLVAMSLAALALALISTATSAAAFLALTLAFGFVSTCMYKLMISVGSEQIRGTPPRLVTFLLLSGSIGGTLAPVASASVVRAFGPHAGPFLALGCYAAALAAVAIALGLERAAGRRVRVPARAAG